MSFKTIASVFIIFSIISLCHLGAYGQSASPTSVDKLIVIAVDVSGSITDDEYEIQKKGLVAAFSDETVQNILEQCSLQGIGVTYMEWSGTRSGAPLTQQVIPWTVLQRASDMDEFAQKLSSSQRSSRGETDIVSAMNYSQSLIGSAPFESAIKIVSISTDGQQGFTTYGVDIEKYVQNTRDQLAVQEITINALAIEEEATSSPYSSMFPSTENDFNLENYLKRNVITGPSSFVTPVSGIDAYSESFKKQLSILFNACVS